MTCVGRHPDVDTLEYPKAQVEGCSWGEYRLYGQLQPFYPFVWADLFV